MTTLSALQDLFQRCREGATGQWSLGSDPQRNIFFDEGRIVFAQSTHPLDRLTHLLVERGRLTQDQMDYAMANLQPGMSVGKNLIQLGFITQRDLLDMAKLQVERVVWGAIGTPNVAPLFMAKILDNTVVRLSLDTPALLLGGLLNLKDRERLLELLGPLSQVMVLDRARLNALDLPPDLSRVPSLINGQRTLLELSREAATEPVRMGAFVLFLREMGWGHLQDQPEPTTQDLLELPLGNEDALATPATFPAQAEETPALLPPIISLSEVPAPDMKRGARPVASLPLRPPFDPQVESGQSPAITSPEEEIGHRAPTPPLFHSIQAASSPTHNLEDFSSALDRIKETWDSEASQGSAVPMDPGFPAEEDEDDQVLPPPSVEDEVPTPYTIESGQAIVPTLSTPIPLLRLPPEVEDLPGPSFGGPRLDLNPKRSQWGLVLGLILLVGLTIAVSYGWTRHKSTSQPPHELIVPSVDSKGGSRNDVTSPMPPPPASSASPSPEAKPSQKLEPKAPEQAVKPPAPKPPPPTPSGDAELGKTYIQGKIHKASLPRTAWTLRLEIACQKETVQHAAKLLDAAGIAHYSLPIKMNDGKICTQIFSGSYKSREEAESHVKGLPSAFITGGNKPKPFLVAEIPEKQ